MSKATKRLTLNRNRAKGQVAFAKGSLQSALTCPMTPHEKVKLSQCIGILQQIFDNWDPHYVKKLQASGINKGQSRGNTKRKTSKSRR